LEFFQPELPGVNARLGQDWDAGRERETKHYCPHVFYIHRLMLEEIFRVTGD
jgi:hypothetical protein